MVVGRGAEIACGEEFDELLTDRGSSRVALDPGTIDGDGAGVREVLFGDHAQGVHEGLLVTGASRDAKGVDLGGGLMTAVEVGGEFLPGGCAVGGELDIGAPVGLGGGEIELEFGFVRAQFVEGRFFGMGGEELGAGGSGFGGRTSEGGVVDEDFQPVSGGEVLDPLLEFGVEEGRC